MVSEIVSFFFFKTFSSISSSASVKNNKYGLIFKTCAIFSINSVEDLQWLEASGITLELSNANGRTLSITSIEKSGNDWVSVKLNLTRSAEPTQTGMIVNTGKATVSISLPNDFTAKYPDGITWDNKQFDF